MVNRSVGWAWEPKSEGEDSVLSSSVQRLGLLGRE
jgi:hypothetical protein